MGPVIRMQGILQVLESRHFGWSEPPASLLDTEALELGLFQLFGTSRDKHITVEFTHHQSRVARDAADDSPGTWTSGGAIPRPSLANRGREDGIRS
jgi:hypothetical protein